MEIIIKFNLTIIMLFILTNNLFAGPNSDAVALIRGIFLDEYYVLLGVNCEYGSEFKPNPEEIKNHSAAGFAFQLTYESWVDCGYSLITDVSYEFDESCYRGRYGFELHMENLYFVSSPDIKFSLAARGGGITRIKADQANGFFYGIGVFFPVHESPYNIHPFIYYLNIDCNQYLDECKNKQIDFALSIKVLYRFEL